MRARFFLDANFGAIAQCFVCNETFEFFHKNSLQLVHLRVISANGKQLCLSLRFLLDLSKALAIPDGIGTVLRLADEAGIFQVFEDLRVVRVCFRYALEVGLFGSELVAFCLHGLELGESLQFLLDVGFFIFSLLFVIGHLLLGSAAFRLDLEEVSTKALLVCVYKNDL